MLCRDLRDAITIQDIPGFDGTYRTTNAIANPAYSYYRRPELTDEHNTHFTVSPTDAGNGEFHSYHISLNFSDTGGIRNAKVFFRDGFFQHYNLENLGENERAAFLAFWEVHEMELKFMGLQFWVLVQLQEAGLTLTDRELVGALQAGTLLAGTSLGAPASSRSWPEKALVGYVEAYGSTDPSNPNVSNAMITGAIVEKYRVFNYAFGTIDKTNKLSLPSAITAQDLATQLTQIHQVGGYALISFGGQNNTFTPGTNPQQAAANTVNFCHQYGFNGIDLDLESIPVEAAYVISYIEAIQQLDASLFITAAPQIGGGYGGPATLAPTTIFTSELLSKANFTALNVQNYNQFGGAKFDGKEDTDVGFISASFGPLTEIVPKGTKILVGEPANAKAGTGLSNPVEIIQDITQAYPGFSGKKVMTYPQYGGIMTWSINYDYAQKWSFAKGVQAVI
ncbi:MAG: glycosyl hydrolase family 18 protein [Bacteroidota bacterium]